MASRFCVGRRAAHILRWGTELELLYHGHSIMAAVGIWDDFPARRDRSMLQRSRYTGYIKLVPEGISIVQVGYATGELMRE